MSNARGGLCVYDRMTPHSERVLPLLVLLLGIATACTAAPTAAPSDSASEAPSAPQTSATTATAQPGRRTESPDGHGTCAPEFTRSHNNSAVQRRLQRRLSTLIEGAGLRNRGGDDGWFDASAHVGRTTSVDLYPRALACSHDRRFRLTTTDTVNGIEVDYGREFGLATARFECRRVVFKIRSGHRKQVHRVAQAFTEQLTNRC